MAMRNRRILVLTPYEAAAKLPAAINRRQMPTDRLGFIGAGRVAKGLSLALSRCGYSISGVAGRAAGDAQRVVEASEIVFLSVPDDAIGAVCAGLRWRAGQAAVHCAGATELAVLQPAADAGAAIGGFHPLVMFADPEIAARSIAGAAIGIEAEEPGAALRITARRTSPPASSVRSSRKASRSGGASASRPRMRRRRCSACCAARSRR